LKSLLHEAFRITGASGEAGEDWNDRPSDRIKTGSLVIPAQAGIQSRIRSLSLDARFRGHGAECVGRRPAA
jgi:hypothetical protein